MFGFTVKWTSVIIGFSSPLAALFAVFLGVRYRRLSLLSSDTCFYVQPGDEVTDSFLSTFSFHFLSKMGIIVRIELGQKLGHKKWRFRGLQHRTSIIFHIIRIGGYCRGEVRERPGVSCYAGLKAVYFEEQFIH